MIEKLHFIVAIFAALAITILSLYQDISFYELSKRLVVIIPVFFIVGLIFRSYLKKLFEHKKVQPDIKEANTEEGLIKENEDDEDDLFDAEDEDLK